jgi:hypothetical protein
MFVTIKKYKELEEKYKMLEMVRLPEKHEERIAELEVKMSKLWMLLTEVSPTGKERLSKYGRKFGGMSKHQI